MPRITSYLCGSSTYTELVGCAERAALKETKDCSVTALAAATGVDYATAHNAMAKVGRVSSSGAYMEQCRMAFRSLGFLLVEVSPMNFIEKYPKAHQILRNVTTHHPDRFKKVWANGETYFLFATRHFCTVVNGEMQDWTRGTARRVNHIFRVVKTP